MQSHQLKIAPLPGTTEFIRKYQKTLVNPLVNLSSSVFTTTPTRVKIDTHRNLHLMHSKAH